MLLLPFVLISALAAGTMPVRGETGMEVVICLGDSLALITVGADGRPVDEGPRPVHCPWEQGAQPALAGAPPATPSLAAILHPFQFAAPAAPSDIRARIRQVSNRGPPVSV